MKKISEIINKIKHTNIKEMNVTTQQLKLAACGVAAFVVVIAAVFGMKGSSSDKKGGETLQPTTTGIESQLQLATDGSGLQKNKDEKITKLINDYLTASKDGNLEALEKLVSNGDELTKEQVQKPYEYVEKVQNVECYTLDGPDSNGDEKSYIVYVYYELKFKDIDTVAPGLMQLYVANASDGSLVIMLDKLDEHVEKAREEALQRDDVKSLIAAVNKNYTDAANSDEKLKALIVKMNAPAKENTDNKKDATKK